MSTNSIVNASFGFVSTISERVARQSQNRLRNATTTTTTTSTTSTTVLPFLVLDERESYWGVADRDVPILIGAAAGAVGLVFLILGAVLIWYCCQFAFKREKSIYSIDDSERDSFSSNGSNHPFSDAVVFMGKTAGGGGSAGGDLDSEANNNAAAAKYMKRSMSAPTTVNGKQSRRGFRAAQAAAVATRATAAAFPNKLYQYVAATHAESMNFDRNGTGSTTGGYVNNGAALPLSTLAGGHDHASLGNSYIDQPSHYLSNRKTHYMAQTNLTSHNGTTYLSPNPRSHMYHVPAALVAVNDYDYDGNSEGSMSASTGEVVSMHTRSLPRWPDGNHRDRTLDDIDSDDDCEEDVGGDISSAGHQCDTLSKVDEDPDDDTATDSVACTMTDGGRDDTDVFDDNTQSDGQALVESEIADCISTSASADEVTLAVDQPVITRVMATNI